jgi:GH24 family phage-related lysozyme (muramidase)
MMDEGDQFGSQKCNAAGVALMKSFEKCRLTAYLDSGKVWTIGWGHTGPEVVAGLVWSQLQADAQFLIDLRLDGEKPVNALVCYELDENQSPRSSISSSTSEAGVSRKAQSSRRSTRAKSTTPRRT